MRWSRLMPRLRARQGGKREFVAPEAEAAGFGESPAPAPQPARRPGDEPAIAAAVAYISRTLAKPETTGGDETAAVQSNVPFPSTGPQGHRARMREKLLFRGPDALADYELLEMLLFLAMPKGDTKPLAKALINQYGSFAAVLAAPQKELLETRGLGVHSVSALKLVQAAAIRLSRAQVIDRPVLANWDRLMEYLTAVLAREQIEQFRVLFLDAKNRLLADEVQARGTVNHTPVYPREVLKRALELHATALILVHNHPSGDPTPSRQDIEMTREIADGGRILSVVLHDHVIIGNGSWASFRQQGLL